MKTRSAISFLALLLLAGCAGKTITNLIQDPSFDQQQIWSDGCRTNIKQLSIALTIYSTDYDDVYPVNDWSAMQPYYNSYRLTACPREFVHGEDHFSYALNQNALGLSSTVIEDVTTFPIFFEVDADAPYMVADFANILTTSRHKGDIYWTSADSAAHVIGE
jgi:hypothetical protein